MGRDLTTVRKVVGSGGWLSRASQFDMHHWLKYRELNDDGKRILLPTEFEYYRDSGAITTAGKRRQSRSAGRRAHQYSMLNPITIKAAINGTSK